MELYLKGLDDYFCEQYSDYVRIAAIEGYRMPEMVTIDREGSIYRKNSEEMKLSRQADCAQLLSRFKETLFDEAFTFHFRFPSRRDLIGDRFRKLTFAKYLPSVLNKYNLSADEAFAKLALEPEIAQGIKRGKFYPEKNTIMALALVSGMGMFDVNNLFALCGFQLSKENVRDVVFEYLITQKIFNPDMISACLKEYRIETIPIAF